LVESKKGSGGCGKGSETGGVARIGGVARNGGRRDEREGRREEGEMRGMVTAFHSSFASLGVF
jgi:hypothetical protein